MTISALLLAWRFYDLNPGTRFKYATLGLLFVNVSIGGGGLTTIANAPNPAGQSVLARYFQDGVAPLYLFLGALVPTAVTALCFLLFR